MQSFSSQFGLSLIMVSLAQACSPSQTPSSSPKVLNGTPTPTGESLNVVALTTAKGDFFCTGVLISDTLIITAAHCLENRAPYDEGVRVVLGEGNDSHHFEPSQLLPVKSGKIVPGYTGFRTGKADRDIAYLVLKEPVDFPDTQKHLVPPALDYAEILAIEQPGQKLRLIGFGCRDQQINCKAGTKYQVDVQINTLSRLTMDVGTSDKGASNGDSGGPAFALLPDGSQRLLGITSGRGVEGAYYGLIRPSICWISKDSMIEIPGASQHCYDQTITGSKEVDAFATACKNPANHLQSYTFAILRKKLDASSCDQLITKLAAVEHLDLSSAYFIDSSLVAHATNMKSLNLTGNPQTSLLPLLTLTNLETLNIDPTKMISTQLEALRAARPELKIVTPTATADIFAGIQQKNDAVFDIALANLISPEVTDNSGQTPLHRAIWLKQDTNVAKLISRGANVNAIEPADKQSALHFAVILNGFNNVKLLVDHDANCHFKNKHDQTPVEIAELYNKGSDMLKYLHSHCTEPK